MSSINNVAAKERTDQLIVRGLSVDFGGFVAVDHVDLTVEPGETRVIIGPNGAGKTDLHQEQSCSGSIIWKGEVLPSSAENIMWAESFRGLMYLRI